MASDSHAAFDTVFNVASGNRATYRFKRSRTGLQFSLILQLLDVDPALKVHRPKRHGLFEQSQYHQVNGDIERAIKYQRRKTEEIDPADRAIDYPIRGRIGAQELLKQWKN